MEILKIVDEKSNEITFKTAPTTVNLKKQKLVKQNRTMDGTLAVDFIASKATIDLKWAVLSDKEFKELMDVIYAKNENLFFTVCLLDGKTEKRAKCFTESISYYPYFFQEDVVSWRDIAITFVEV